LLVGASSNIVLDAASGEANATIFTTTSDQRLKTNIVELSNALVSVASLRPVSYVWNNGHQTLNPALPEIGFLAQEVEAVLPNIVATHDDAVLVGGRKAVAYDRITAVLVRAVQELKAEVDAIKAKLA
jgi:hypothetical protein